MYAGDKGKGKGQALHVLSLICLPWNVLRVSRSTVSLVYSKFSLSITLLSDAGWRLRYLIPLGFCVPSVRDGVAV